MSTLTSRSCQTDLTVKSRGINTTFKSRQHKSDLPTTAAQRDRKSLRVHKTSEKTLTTTESTAQEQLPVQEKQVEEKSEETVLRIPETSNEVLFCMQKKIVTDSGIIRKR